MQYLVQHTGVDTTGTENWWSTYDDAKKGKGSDCTGALLYSCSGAGCCVLGWDIAILEGFLGIHNALLSTAAQHRQLKTELER